MTPPVKMLNLGTLQLPILDFAIQGTAILGIKESGKSYSGTYVAEQFCDAHIPWICFDPVGIWRWMRVPGKGPNARGFPVVVAGGRSPDIPLTVDNAPTIVRRAMQDNVNLVVDLFDPQISKKAMRRIVREGCQVLLHENPEHGLRHVFFEEAADLVPQRIMGDMAQTYGAIEELCRKGGNSQLGYTLVSTRPEDINKSVLELCDALLLHRQKGKNSILGLRKWLATNDQGMADEIAHTLGILGPGQCWVWARESMQPVLTRIPAKGSHHPDRRQQTSPLHLAKSIPAPLWNNERYRHFIDDMRETLQTIEEIRRDPVAGPAAHVKARVAEAENLQVLQKQIAENRITPTAEIIERAEQEGFRKGLQSGIEKGYKAGTSTVAGMLHGIVATGNALLEQLSELARSMAEARIQEIIEDMKLEESKASLFTKETPYRSAREGLQLDKFHAVYPAQPDKTTTLPATADASNISRPAMKLLQILSSRHPAKFTVKEWASLAGVTTTGGHFQTNRNALIKAGFVECTAHEVEITAAGLEHAGTQPQEPPRDRAALLAFWQKRLNSSAGRMLELFVKHFEHIYSKENLADDLGISVTGGHFGSSLGTLVKNNLVEKNDNWYQAASIFRIRDHRK